MITIGNTEGMDDEIPGTGLTKPQTPPIIHSIEIKETSGEEKK